MISIVKICINHGELKEDQVYKESNKSKKGFILRCSQCRLEQGRRWREQNREIHRAGASRARNESRKKYRKAAANGESCEKPKANIWKNEDKKKDPIKYKQSFRRDYSKRGKIRSIRAKCRSLNLSVESYESMLKEQDNKCAICFQYETRLSRNGKEPTRLAIDHCHNRNIARGLLCHSCNTGIGKFEDNVERMQAAIAYLLKHQ